MRRVLFAIILLGLVLTACGPAAAPTIDPAQVQATAAAEAATMVAQTQAAMPTSTPVPPSPTPTDTPAPSPTLETLPSLQPASTISAGGTPGGDPCSGLLVANAAGPLTTIKIDNAVKAPITVSLYLNQTKFGECGYRSYSLGPLDSVYLTDLPQGCYSAFALINDPKKPSKAFTSQAMCANNDDKWTFIVQTDVIKFLSP